MKRVIGIVIGLLIVAATIFTMSCRGGSESYVMIPNGDSVSTAYLIGERHVGNIDRGATLRRLYKLYGEDHVKELKSPEREHRRDTVAVASYYAYNSLNKLLLIARSDDQSSDPEMQVISIKDGAFMTQEGINIDSTVEELRSAYPDAVLVNTDGRYFVFVPSLDLYMRIAEENINGVDPHFMVDISIDSLRHDAKFESMTVSWNNHTTNILTPQFWQDMLSRIIKWVIYELPIILFILLIFVFSRRLLRFSIKKINDVAHRQVKADNTIDTGEAAKRVDTITGILHGVLNIFLWSIFILILLSKFNINIAPILASAGILGLAVGFGAQELVRDFISGFFILLEDQLRTGDMAIINDTTGVVEKIELRTVTLRDPSGVVHIFQNGKINSLSNMTKEWSAIVLEIGVAYKEDVDKVMSIMKDVGREMREGRLGKLMLADVEVWGLDAFADSAVVIKLVIKTRPMQQWRIKREYQRLLKIRFDAEGIEIPFPHVTIYTGDKTKPMPLEVQRPTEK